ncbi:MAG: polyprenol monophosphomannose synthase [Chitinivibrionia bacterium]|nr:polyprenol monophosphomannose synthase [Chitinivibrionia bacterium]
MATEPKVLIIIPTYNERDNIPLIIPQIKKRLPKAHILIVDDNSPDGTSQIAKDMSKNIDGIFVLDRCKKDGLGKAYIAGFKWALEDDKKYDLIFEMDADFSHNPDYLPNFIEAAQTADLVIGSRYIDGKVNVVNWPLKRLLLSYFGNMAARFIAGIKIMDCTGGFKCFRVDTLRAINLDGVASSGYSFQVEMNYYVQKKGLKIKEIPIIFKDRELGVSKMSSKIVSEALALLWKLRLKSLFTK